MTNELMSMSEEQQERFKQILAAINSIAMEKGVQVPHMGLIRGAYNLTVR